LAQLLGSLSDEPGAQGAGRLAQLLGWWP
jgi:hypothetical protein